MIYNGIKYFVLAFLLVMPALFAQQGGYITVIGDSLVGKNLNGEMIREVYGNVNITQDNIVITCNKAVQFISRNDAELIGNVTVKQDSLTIKTEHGFYYGNPRIAESTTGVVLDDGNVILSADSGKYYFNDALADFKGDVKLYDTTSTLTSQELLYYRREARAVAVQSVKIVDKESVIESDSLVHFRQSRITYADNNVKITSNKNNVVIYGQHLEDYPEKSYTLINKEPLLVQVDTTFVDPDSASLMQTNGGKPFRLDTLVIKSLVMEAYRDTANIFYATDSVKIVRGGFASLNDYSVFFRSRDKIVTVKKKSQPLLWNDNTQITGDSITVYLSGNSINHIDIDASAFLISQSPQYPKRYDQISANRISINFAEGGISSTEMKGSTLSIYYMYEGEEPNGLIKSSSRDGLIKFKEKKVDEVRLYVAPVSEYHPENEVTGNEPSYTLPGFKFYMERPVKQELLESTNNSKINPEEKAEGNGKDKAEQ